MAMNSPTCSKFSTAQVFSLTQSTAGGITITSNRITAPVSETLYAVTGLSNGPQNTTTISANYPFAAANTDSTGSGRWNATYDIGAAQGSQTASWAITNNDSNDWAILLLGFRPMKSGTAPTGGVRHHASVY
jgi:hypothetical protein